MEISEIKKPLSRFIKEGSSTFCTICGSSIKFKYFGCIKKIGCIQPECENYYEKHNKVKAYKDSDFKIEYYPETHRYYPTYKGRYLYRDYYSGIYNLEDNLRWAKYGDLEKEALKIITVFKEQQFKENIKIIEVK